MAFWTDLGCLDQRRLLTGVLIENGDAPVTLSFRRGVDRRPDLVVAVEKALGRPRSIQYDALPVLMRASIGPHATWNWHAIPENELYFLPGHLLDIDGVPEAAGLRRMLIEFRIEGGAKFIQQITWSEGGIKTTTVQASL